MESKPNASWPENGEGLAPAAPKRRAHPSTWLPWVPLGGLVLTLVNLGITVWVAWAGVQWKADQDKTFELFKRDLNAAHLVLALGQDQRARNVSISTTDAVGFGDSLPARVAPAPANRSIDIRLSNSTEGIQASGVRILVHIGTPLQTLDARSGQIHSVEYSTDRRQATISLEHLADGEDFLFGITATQLEDSSNPLTALGANITAVCQNCIGVAEL